MTLVRLVVGGAVLPDLVEQRVLSRWFEFLHVSGHVHVGTSGDNQVGDGSSDGFIRGRDVRVRFHD
jgi:hypothetical protein